MPSKAQKRKRQLQAYAKKRARRPEPTVSLPGTLLIKHSVEKRVIRDHPDVLQNIESCLVNAKRDAEEIDDSTVAEVLRNSILGETSEDPVVEWATNLLAEIRDIRADVSDELWRDALRVVYNSLQNHSPANPGDVSYLNFVSRFV